jgi:type IV pilus assembly protein PilM
MARKRAVGLDIGTRTVTITQVETKGGRSVVTNVGQFELPEGAVRDGEVLDVAAVAATVKEGFAESGIKTKQVHLGVANQRVVVRQVNLPSMPDDELRQALPYQVQEFIPIPVEQAELDYHVLDKVTDEDGGETLRVLLVAAQKDMIASHVDAAKQAGLKPVSVDLNPFALLRALFTESFGDVGEVLVDVGAGVTSIVVHQGGVPLFVRILVLGGDDITEAVAAAEGLPVEEAELRKRELSAAGELATAPQVADAVREFVDEIRSSLDYFRAQTGVGRIDRVVVAGGGAVLAGLVDQLGTAVALPVELAQPFDRIPTTINEDEQLLAAWGPVLTTSIGLALGGLQ